MSPVNDVGHDFQLLLHVLSISRLFRIARSAGLNHELLGELRTGTELFTYPTNIGTTRATPMATQLVVISDEVETWLF